MSGVAPLREARRDGQLRAVVRERRPLRYDAGADPALDRPAHVRAGSGLARLGDHRFVVQDDAAFLAVLHAGRVEALPLPAGPGGLRQFEEARGNKAHKPDLESLVALGDAQETLLGFGSGSTRARDRILRVRHARGAAPQVELIDGARLYAQLRETPSFAGEALNVEGAFVLGDRLWLLQRGNGEGQTVIASASLELTPLLAWLEAPTGAPPPLLDVQPWSLGSLGGTKLTFTDGCALPEGGWAFLAAAEASADTYGDGPVTGTAIGLVSVAGEARWTPLLHPSGEPFLLKAEGIAPGEAPDRFELVLDLDDPTQPSELCVVELSPGG